jgi:hypothetical protein
MQSRLVFGFREIKAIETPNVINAIFNKMNLYCLSPALVYFTKLLCAGKRHAQLDASS